MVFLDRSLSPSTAPDTAKNTEPQAIRAALDCLAQALPHGTTVIVFGSHATGRAQADSDIDLFVVEPEVADRTAETIHLTAWLGRRLIPADVVVMSREMFARQREIPNTLAWRVARQGIEYAIAH